MSNIKRWRVGKQFESNYAATPLTKYSYGFEPHDSVYLSENETYIKALSELKQVGIWNDNTKLDDVDLIDRYRYGRIIGKNVMESDLYLRHFNYLDFYYGYMAYMANATPDIEKDFTEFFTSLVFDAPDDGYDSYYRGYMAYMNAFNFTFNDKNQN